jgi:uncharacterized protein YndB with AHSA1/START domain
MEKNPITIEATINAPLSKVWEYWNSPEHITQWAFAADDWEASDAKNDLREGGKFSTIMSAKDKSASFEFGGVYSVVEEISRIEYDMSDGRHVSTEFSETAARLDEASGEVREGVKVTQTFDPEQENPRDMQRDGWQAILDNFKKHVENN